MCAKRTGGSSGPSGMDSDGWKRILCSKQFKAKPMELCDSLADLARKLCTHHINPVYLKAFTACRLVPLNKKPGVRPVGIGEVLRYIVGKALTKVANGDLAVAVLLRHKFAQAYLEELKLRFMQYAEFSKMKTQKRLSWWMLRMPST